MLLACDVERGEIILFRDVRVALQRKHSAFEAQYLGEVFND